MKDKTSTEFYVAFYAELHLTKASYGNDKKCFPTRLAVREFNSIGYKLRAVKFLKFLQRGVWPDYGSGILQKLFPDTNFNPPPPLPVDASLRRSARIDRKRTSNEPLVSKLHTVVSAKSTKQGGQFIQHKILMKKLPSVSEITPKCHSRTHPGRCAARSINHRVDYYHSGTFGMLMKNDVMLKKRLCPCINDDNCQCRYMCRYCESDLLRSEYIQHLKGSFMKCCGNGKYKSLQSEYEYRQKTPLELKEFTRGPKKFMKDIISYNTELSFASVTTEEGDKPRMPPGRLAPVLLNGCSTYQIGSIYPPVDEKGASHRPLFAQVYILDPSQREATRAWLNRDVLKMLDQMLRASDPFCALYKQAHEIYSEQFAAYQKELAKRSPNSQEQLKAPRLRMVILSNREVQAVGALERGQHLHKTEHPEVPNIGLIWVDNEGEPPVYKGAWVMDKENKTKQMPYLDPQIDPLCFPLICPYGQMGYRYGIKIPQSDEDVVPSDDRDEKEEDASNNLVTEECISNVDSEASGDEDAIDEVDPAEARKRFDDDDIFISYRQWIRYMMMFRKAKDSEGDNYHHIWSKGKLAEAYILHCATRIERHEIDEVKKAQKKYRKVLRGNLPEVLQKRLHKKHPGAKLGKIFLDPVTVKGSRRYMQRAYADAMSIIMKTGNPFRFVTFTGNPYWPEITEIIKDQNLTWLNRVDAVCRIFTDKAEEFIRDLTEKHVLGKLSGYVFSLEHQKRGMPHLHCLLIPDPDNDMLGTVNFLEDFISARIPHDTDEDTEAGDQQRLLRELVIKHNLHSCSEDSMCLFGGKCIKRFPKNYSSTTTLAENMFPIYRRLPPMPECQNNVFTQAETAKLPSEPEHEDNPVTSNYEDEECDNVSVISCKSDVPSIDSADADVEDRDEPTKRYNPAPIPEEAMPHDFDCTQYGSKHEAVQKNGVVRVFDDRHVVPYNAFLTLKYRTHINVEDCWGQKCVNYVLKYITKGHDLAYVKVTPSDTAPDEYDYDETRVRLVRYMTASEAFMKLWSYPIVQLSHTVEKLFVHDIDGPGLLYEEGYEDELLENPKDVAHDKSKLLGFFKLNQDILANPHKHPAEYHGTGLLYTEVNKFYAYDKQSGRWRLRKTGLSDKAKARRLSRLCSVSSADAQLTAIRLLLINDLKRVDESHPELVDYKLLEPNCDSFVAACRARGLIEDNKMWKQTLLEARCEFTSDLRLIHFFAMLILHSNPPDVANCFEYLLSLMTPPGCTAYQMEQKRQMILNRLEWLFTANDKSCKMLGLPSPANYNPAELEEEMDDETYQAFVTADRDPIRATRWDSYAQKTLKQKEAFKRLSSAIACNSAENLKQQCFFLGGSGGTGKTFLYNTIIAWCKSKNVEVAVTASTGIAATLLIGGTTLHSSFRIPLDLSKSKTPKIDYNSETADKIRRTKVIIVDEVSCLHKLVLEYLDEVIREVSPQDQRQRPFGGKSS
uniref:ATP-dependent DNA helicase n=1 Tax=Ditylenchus dipsaci TaxID=166011 RepID=A0A915CXY9_9BILA